MAGSMVIKGSAGQKLGKLITEAKERKSLGGTAPEMDDEEARLKAMIEFQRKYGKAGRAGTILSPNLSGVGGSKLG